MRFDRIIQGLLVMLDEELDRRAAIHVPAPNRTSTQTDAETSRGLDGENLIIAATTSTSSTIGRTGQHRPSGRFDPATPQDIPTTPVATLTVTTTTLITSTVFATLSPSTSNCSQTCTATVGHSFNGPDLVNIISLCLSLISLAILLGRSLCERLEVPQPDQLGVLGEADLEERGEKSAETDCNWMGGVKDIETELEAGSKTYTVSDVEEEEIEDDFVQVVGYSDMLKTVDRSRG